MRILFIIFFLLLQHVYLFAQFAQRPSGVPEPTFKSGIATLQIIVADSVDMPDECELWVFNHFDFSPDEQIIALEDSITRIEIPAMTAQPITVDLSGLVIPCYIAPQDTTTIVIDSDGRIRFEGYIAELQPVWSDKRVNTKLDGNPQDRKNLFAGMMHKQIRDYFIDKHKAAIATIDSLDAKPAYKELLKSQVDLSCFFCITDIEYFFDEYSDQKPDSLDAGFFDVLHDGFDLVNTPLVLYNDYLIIYLNAWAWDYSKSIDRLKQILKTDSGTLFDLLNAAHINQKISSFIPATEDELAGLPSGLAEVMKHKNDSLQATLGILKKKTDNVHNDSITIADEDILSSILSKHNNDVILVDFWATWCGPCRKAIEMMKPMKEELAGKDIAYIYIAGENSPQETWTKMKDEIKGEHYRITKSQWDYVVKAFRIESIPTYMILNRDKDITFRSEGYPGTEKMKAELEKAAQ